MSASGTDTMDIGDKGKWFACGINGHNNFRRQLRLVHIGRPSPEVDMFPRHLKLFLHFLGCLDPFLQSAACGRECHLIPPLFHFFGREIRDRTRVRHIKPCISTGAVLGSCNWTRSNH